jgi:hypothetical protein
MEVITLKKGDAYTFTETVSGLASLAGYSARMVIFQADGTSIATVTGTVNATGLTATYDLVNETTKLFPLGTHGFETKVFDASDHVYTPSQGYFVVEEANVSDPT